MENSIFAGFAVFMIIFLLVLGLIFIAASIFCLIGGYKFYEKAGVPGWKAIIPFYNQWTLVEIAGLDPYWFVLLLAPTIFTVLSYIVPFLGIFTWLGSIVAIVANISIFTNLSKMLHKDTGWLVCGVLFNFIVIAIAGFSSKTEFDKSVELNKDGLFANMRNNNTNNSTNNNSMNSENQKEEN